MRYCLLCVVLAACQFPVPDAGGPCDPDGACPDGQVCGAGDRCEPEPSTCVDQLSAGDEHTCVIRDDQTAWCWGRNTSGQLGDGSTDSIGAPVQVAGGMKLVAIAGGAEHTCAVAVDKSVWCWGNNDSGQLGGGVTDSKTPVQVGGLTSVTAIASGKAHSCGLLEDGSVKCWGDSGPGQFADGSRVSNVKQIAAGGTTTCAVSGDGALACWDRGSAEIEPLPDGVAGVAHVAIGQEFLCVLAVGGAVYCVGSNEDGQLGRPGSSSSVLVKVPLPVPANAIVAGPVYACAVAEPDPSDGRRNLWCWGEDGDHQLADNLSQDHPSPFRTTYVNAVAAVGGMFHLCALSAAGGVTCSGFNGRGQLGDGQPTMRGKPPPAIAGLAGVTSIAAGDDHTCAVSGGAVWCWGANARGQLGDGSLFDRSTPVRVQGVERAVSVVANNEHSCALLEDGTAMCWGSNTNSQLSNGERPSDSHFPGAIAQPVIDARGAVVREITQLAAGGVHTCALVGGSVLCWGANGAGQIGNEVDDGKNANAPDPVHLPGTTVLEITAGAGHSCALMMGGSVMCWGYNASGQLGNGDSTHTDRSKPVAVQMLGGVEHIRAYRHHTCAITGGHAICWGEGDHGEIGSSDSGNHYAPDAPVQMLGAPTLIATGGEHSCALTAGGLSCWGTNSAGQLGDGSFDRHFSAVPAAIADRGKVVQVVGGGEHSCALLDDGTVTCWGLDDRGQLGDGAFEKRGRVAPVLPCR